MERGISHCRFCFALEADVQLRDLAEALYADIRVSCGRPSVHFALKCHNGALGLYENAEEVVAVGDLSTFFQETEWALTEAAMAGLGHFFQLHAGVVSFANQARLLIGPPDAGKTSLALVLAERGATIFTYEVALVEPHDLRVHLFRRDLIVHRQTQQLFAAALAGFDPPSFKVFDTYYYLAPSNVNGGIVVAEAEIVQLIFPVLRPGEAVEMRSVGQAEAARHLLEQSFNIDSWSAAGVDLIGRLAENCEAVEVVFGDAREAAEQLSTLP